MAQINAKEAELAPLKLAVNTLCKQLGQPDAYSNVVGGSGQPGSPLTLSWKLDQFYNRPLAGCVVDILEARKSRGMEGPASIDDIYNALKQGGYKFEGTSGNEENTKRAIKIALTKNTAQFAKVKEDIFGLKKWYGGGRSPRKTTAKSENGNGESEAAEDSFELDPPPQLEEKAEKEGGKNE